MMHHASMKKSFLEHLIFENWLISVGIRCRGFRNGIFFRKLFFRKNIFFVFWQICLKFFLRKTAFEIFFSKKKVFRRFFFEKKISKFFFRNFFFRLFFEKKKILILFWKKKTQFFFQNYFFKFCFKTTFFEKKFSIFLTVWFCLLPDGRKSNVLIFLSFNTIIIIFNGRTDGKSNV